MVTLKLISIEGQVGLWRISPDKKLGLSTGYIGSQELIELLKEVFPDPARTSSWRTTMPNVEFALPSTAKGLPKVGFPFAPRRHTIKVVTFPSNGATWTQWLEGWKEVLVNPDVYDTVEFEGRPSRVYEIRVELPARTWYAEVSGNKFIRPRLKTHDENGDDASWAGGNHDMHGLPCFGDLVPQIRKGFIDFKDIDMLFFNSTFSYHLQYGWRWIDIPGERGYFPEFDMDEETGLYYIPKEELIYNGPA